MKRIWCLLLTLMLILSITACGNKKKETEEVIVFAAASLTETLTEIGNAYMKEHTDVKLTFSFESSGTLKTQIEEGAECDLFISAAQKQMNALSEAGLLQEETRLNLLENQVVLAVPEGNPAGIENFADLGSDKLNLLCLGNEDVPVGSYSLEILTSLNLLADLEASKKITYGSNVKEVTTQISEATVDAGIIYATDAFSAGLTVVDAADETLCSPVIYPAALLKDSKETEAAKNFLNYLSSEESDAVFEKVGFTPLGE